MLKGPEKFSLPKEGTYLLEAGDDFKRNPLINEDWEDRDAGFDALPVRLLHDFVFFDPRNLDLVSLSCLSGGEGFCEGFGRAVASSEDHEDRDYLQDEGVPLHLSNVVKQSLDLDKECIWVHTQYAWYILQMPSSEYESYFFPFYKKETLLRIVLRYVSEDPALSLQDFFQEMSLECDPTLDRCWTEDDLVQNFVYSRSQLQKIVDAYESVKWADIKNSPLIDELLRDPRGSPRTPHFRDSGPQPPAHRTPQGDTTKRAVVGERKPKAKKPKPVTTTVSHIVHSLIHPHYNIEFDVVGAKPNFLREYMFSREQPPYEVDLGGFTGILKPGDFVLVNEGDSSSSDQPQIQFAQILYFLDERKRKFHARWFVHGSETILEDLAFGQELFLSIADHCRDVDVICVVGKCKVFRLSLQQRSNLQWPAGDAYFFSSAWDRTNPVDFIEVQIDQIELPPARNCPRCDSEKSASRSHERCGSGIVIKNQEYHKRDFIRIQEIDSDQLTCSIGQIVGFKTSGVSLQIKVRKLGRLGERHTGSFCTENELFMTCLEEEINPRKVLGRCRVTHISRYQEKLTDFDWLERQPSSFYIQYQAESLHGALTPLPPTALEICDTCEKLQLQLDQLDLECRREISLRAFDPFCGVGGFGLGLSRGCSMHTTHGVELNASAAETMRQNFPPETCVLHDDANLVLQHAAQGLTGVPQPGQIDLIYSGPPCQNDSTLNRHKTDRKCLAFTALSFLDILQAPFYVMESVPGFLLGKVQPEGSTQKIKAGDLKLVVKVLHFLGYNVVGRLLHARSFGDPQTRSRFFIVATRPEYGDFPSPEATHIFKNGKPRHPGLVAHLGKGLKVKAAVSPPGCGLHKVATAFDAISDLPLFDWENTGQDDTRPENITTVSCGQDELWGIPDSSFHYNSPPMNNFQHRARRNLGLSDPKFQHQTKHFPSNVVKNVGNVPLISGADYRHLDQGSREWSLRDPVSAKAIRGYQAGGYTRLDPDGYFHTIVTNVGPLAKQSAVLHPICKRILTVRELARAQGFPDDFVFYSETDKIDDYHKQIGNSVPFGVSAALGRSIQEMVFRKWKLDKAQKVPLN